MMTIAEAQKEIRAAYLGGFAGQLVSGLLWLGSAALASWGPARWAILLLVAGGFFIFPATLLTLLLIGHRVRASRANPLNALAMQVAFVLPLSLPLVFAAALHKLNWFYPALMIVLGAHYLPFTFLYGMRMFIALCGALVGAGVLVGLYGSGAFSPGAWITGGILLLFAALGRIQVGRELASRPRSGES